MVKYMYQIKVYYMKAIIYYFTGTGNTRIAARAIKQELMSYDYDVTLFEIRKNDEDVPNPNDYDVVGFGYPIHAFNAPQFFLKQIKKIAKVDHKKAFIFKTSGEPFGFNKASSWSLSRILKKRGFELMMDRHLLMPYNIMFRYDDRLAKQMYIHTHEMAKVIAYDIKMNRKKRIKFNVLHFPIMYLFRVQWFGAKVNGPLFHVKKEQCTSCSACEKVCPTNNIILNEGIPAFGGDCTMCMGCVLSCPEDAIRPGLISGLRLNGKYPFKKLLGDDHVSADFIHEGTKGYFKLFKSYYETTQNEIDKVAEWVKSEEKN